MSTTPALSASSATAGDSDGCGPHARSRSSQPDAASIRMARARCTGSLEWDAHASASSRGPKPKRSAAPSCTMGSDWKGFAAERQKVTRSGSPADATSEPSALTTATDTV